MAKRWLWLGRSLLAKTWKRSSPLALRSWALSHPEVVLLLPLLPLQVVLRLLPLRPPLLLPRRKAKRRTMTWAADSLTKPSGFDLGRTNCVIFQLFPVA